MQIETLPILLFILCSTGLAVGLLVVSRLFGPHRAGAVKQMPYESGMDPIHDTRRRFDVQFHLVAIAFLVFDVEVLFLYPWAVSFDMLGLFGFVEMVIFIVTVFIAYTYVWRRGGLDWD